MADQESLRESHLDFFNTIGAYQSQRNANSYSPSFDPLSRSVEQRKTTVPESTLQIPAKKFTKDKPSADTEGAFFGLKSNMSVLQGGVVKGGGVSIFINPIPLPSEPDETLLWIECEYTAYVADGVLLAGGDLTSAEIKKGTIYPMDSMPTASDPDAVVNCFLGYWYEGRFHPAAPGNITLFHCIGTLYETRISS